MKIVKVTIVSFLIILAVAVAAFFLYRHFKTNNGDGGVPELTPKEVSAEIQKHGEKLYREKYYLPLVEVYKKMLAQMPESVELKKKLAFAYFGAERYEDALPLLEEVSRAGGADDEVKRELEYIKRLK